MNTEQLRAEFEAWWGVQYPETLLYVRTEKIDQYRAFEAGYTAAAKSRDELIERMYGHFCNIKVFKHREGTIAQQAIDELKAQGYGE